ncbi:MAG: trypsin-like peptidase domain-containing protein [Candidatus Krumholzibacteria bacterium]|nr:trypsin-like peptidase domain-containing protein [Candidatus Krumholzibacteria bacterium]
MTQFESRWSRAVPWVVGALFGLSLAMLMTTSVMLWRVGTGRAFYPKAPGNVVLGGAGLFDADAMVAARHRVGPAVVSVTTFRTRIVTARARNFYEWWQINAGRLPAYETRKYPIYGSGLLVNQDGYIVTNEHVVRGAEEIYVTMIDSTEVPATLVGAAPEFDVALLKIEGSDLPFAPIGDSDALEIGEPVIAIGSPFTYLFNDNQPTVTAGVVSALHRDVKETGDEAQIFKNMIQTDAVINPGNSGGPLVSMRGEVIGISTFVFSTASGSSNIGMGFAIPSNTVRMVVDEIRRYGHFRSVWTGLVVSGLTPDVARNLGIPLRDGLVVMALEEGGPAEQAGLAVGDVIVEMNGNTIRDSSQASRAIFGLQVGDELEVVVWRSGSTLTFTLTLVEAKDQA